MRITGIKVHRRVAGSSPAWGAIRFFDYVQKNISFFPIPSMSPPSFFFLTRFLLLTSYVCIHSFIHAFQVRCYSFSCIHLFETTNQPTNFRGGAGTCRERIRDNKYIDCEGHCHNLAPETATAFIYYLYDNSTCLFEICHRFKLLCCISLV